MICKLHLEKWRYPDIVENIKKSYLTVLKFLLSNLSLLQEREAETRVTNSSNFINAFQLIAMSHDLDLSGLFKEKVYYKMQFIYIF